MLTVEEIARVAHEVNRALCQAYGDGSQPAWDDAPDWQRRSAYDGVRAHLARDMTPAESHEEWMRHKIADGWTHGTEKDAMAKRHPCLLPYDALPVEQRAKDHIFRAVVRALSG